MEDSGVARHVPLSKQSSREFEEGSSEYSSDDEDMEFDEGHVTGSPKARPGTAQVLPHSLSDQFKLLTPTSQRRNTDPLTSSQAVSDLYSTVNKKTKSSRAKSEGEDHSTSELQSGFNRTRSDSLASNSSSGNTEQDQAVTPGRSLFMHDLTPPWIVSIGVISVS